MKEFPFYVGEPQSECAKEPAELSVLKRVGGDRRKEARAYIADAGLVAAVNVALLLGHPLLLTGEPGTGKTQLAYSLGCQLGYDVLPFETKSTSDARELFYTYNTLGRFHVAQLARQDQSVDGRDYIEYRALGLAILLSREEEEVRKWLPLSFKHVGKRRSVVLIDEIDKAPRDFPNDLLNEIEKMYFRAPTELGLGSEEIAADTRLRPIVVITSNSEKNLPDAFLRRCVFYNISFPDRERLKEIVLAHLPPFEDPAHRWLKDALDFFHQLRGLKQRLDKPPATAELLDWLIVLRSQNPRDGLRQQDELLRSSLNILVKTSADQQSAESLLEKWSKE